MEAAEGSPYETSVIESRGFAMVDINCKISTTPYATCCTFAPSSVYIRSPIICNHLFKKYPSTSCEPQRRKGNVARLAPLWATFSGNIWPEGNYNGIFAVPQHVFYGSRSAHSTNGTDTLRLMTYAPTVNTSSEEKKLRASSLRCLHRL